MACFHLGQISATLFFKLLSQVHMKHHTISSWTQSKTQESNLLRLNVSTNIEHVYMVNSIQKGKRDIVVKTRYHGY